MHYYILLEWDAKHDDGTVATYSPGQSHVWFLLTLSARRERKETNKQ